VFISTTPAASTEPAVSNPHDDRIDWINSES